MASPTNRQWHRRNRYFSQLRLRLFAQRLLHRQSLILGYSALCYMPETKLYSIYLYHIKYATIFQNNIKSLKLTSSETLRKCSCIASPVCLTILAKQPFSICNRRCGWSNSTISPFSTTRILSLSITDSSLCATVRTVQSWNLLRIVLCINASVAGSTLAIASSSTKMRVFLTIARARHSSWRCPALYRYFYNKFYNEYSKLFYTLDIKVYTYLRFRPPHSIGWSRGTNALWSSTSSRAAQRLVSSNSWNGSRLSRSDVENSTGSWGIMAIRLRSSCKPKLLVSNSSMSIWPSVRARRNNAEINDDFPAPVRPTIPIWKV